MQVHKILMVMQSSNDKAADDKPKDDIVNDASTSRTFSAGGPSSPHHDAFIPTNAYYIAYDNELDIFTAPVQSMGAEADFNNMESSTVVSPIPTHRAHIDHPKDQILGNPTSAVQTKGMAKKSSEAPTFMEPKKVAQALDDESLISTKKSLCDEFKALMHKRFQMSSMWELTFFLGLQVKQSKEGIFISQDTYVAEVLKKFNFSFVKTASKLIETQKPLVKDEEAVDVNVHLYRSMTRSLMYLIASRPDIMFAVCACSRDSPFDLEAYSDSDYVGANLNIKSTTGGCQFIGKRLISWQYKKQTIVTTSTTKVEYVAGANCCGQVLWIQN
uniref:Copia protein n=1 Tax=Tanacetum cinerariifolium TaxID=118510 RepID=A0A6L2JY84_TANCI|nr:copia protein [Tanacetum cinerariifolium]